VTRVERNAGASRSQRIRAGAAGRTAIYETFRFPDQPRAMRCWCDRGAGRDARGPVPPGAAPADSCRAHVPEKAAVLAPGAAILALHLFRIKIFLASV